MTTRNIIIFLLFMAFLPWQASNAQNNNFSISGDITGISDYRFRGVSLTNKDPAIQGTLTIEHSSGFYVSAWGSNIADFNGADVEVDFMAGYVFQLPNGVSLDVGVMEYVYPGGTGTNYFETYAAVSIPVEVGELSFGVNYTPSQNNIGSNDNIYLSAGYSFPILDTGFSGSASFGYEDGAFGNDKTDWSLGISYNFEQFTVGAAYIDTNLGAGNGAATGLGYLALNF